MYALIGVTLVGFLLRIHALGDLGFRWDEDLTSIAVQAINQNGYPLLPSGMVYPRFLPLQYLLAGWTSLFGFSEFSIRFPIAVFGTALIPVTYIIAKDLVNTKVALIAATFIALDFWQVELARTARMYAPFYLFFAVYTISVYRGLLWRRRPWKYAILPLGLLAISLHDIG
ncbi:MAG: glycosyltransferase family 39 protein, partial [Gammaproteobacteria bacterium]|nr:glycosyltransferase family 39 protein [Gammaproteobacteria bacterium]